VTDLPCTEDQVREDTVDRCPHRESRPDKGAGMDILEQNSDGEGPRPATDWSRSLLIVVAACMAMTAAFSGFTAWTVYRAAERDRLVNCAYVTPEDVDQSYEQLVPHQQEVIRALDCDVPGR
jgi:hypothetical protein